MIGETRAAKAATDRNLRMRVPRGGPKLRLGNGYGTLARTEVLPGRARLATYAAGGADVADGGGDGHSPAPFVRQRVQTTITAHASSDWNSAGIDAQELYTSTAPTFSMGMTSSTGQSRSSIPST